MDSSSPKETSAGSEKLHKVLARLGFGSRRACEIMITQGRVQVNGQVASIGARIDVSSDEVRVDGKVVGVRPDLVYILLNKPAGYISSVSDPQGRRTVMDLVTESARVYPVGRLDYESEGLLILTNDGDLTNLITHPSHGVEKEYLVNADREISNRAISQLRRGVNLEDGPTAPAKVGRISETAFRITIHEGRNRQIRRMCEAVGCKVQRLIRTRIGKIRDPHLPQGAWRHLTPAEVLSLREDALSSTSFKAFSNQKGS